LCFLSEVVHFGSLFVSVLHLHLVLVPDLLFITLPFLPSVLLTSHHHTLTPLSALSPTLCSGQRKSPRRSIPPYRRVMGQERYKHAIGRGASAADGVWTAMLWELVWEEV
jgi:hypothetical protein